LVVIVTPVRVGVIDVPVEVIEIGARACVPERVKVSFVKEAAALAIAIRLAV
jgi:hypothetical protein